MNYDEFRSLYETMHPASIPTKGTILSDYPGWLKWLALIMFFAVSIVSGVHTVSTMRYTMIESMVIPENAKDLAALMAFFGFEVALFVSVFGWLRKDNRWIAYSATLVVFLVIVLANVQDIERSADGNVFTGLMVFGIGIGTPLVALFSGKLFVDIYRRQRVLTEAANAQYAEMCKAWDKEIEQAWKREEKKHKADNRPVDKGVQSVDNVQSTRQYTMDASDRVRQHLEENPEDVQMSVRKLADLLRVSKTTVQNILPEYRDVESNGHH